MRNKGGAPGRVSFLWVCVQTTLEKTVLQQTQSSGMLLGKAWRNIDEWGSGFRFRFNGVTGDSGNYLRKNGTRPNTNRQGCLLLMGKRLWLASGKNFIAEELAAFRLPSLLT